MTRVATATSSAIAARAADEVADAGGNAIDCAIAAALVAMNTEPGVCALAGGAFVTVWAAGADPVTIDGNVAVPGFGTDASPLEEIVVDMEYGGGIRTLVGSPSVAVPGAVAALDCAADRYGSVPWSLVVQPAIKCARDGFPLSSASHYYLQYSGVPIFGRSTDGFRALHDDQDRLRAAGERIVVPHLADSLQDIADNGSHSFYRGELAEKISAHVQAGGGRLSREDLGEYRAVVRPSLQSSLAGWQIASNPAPAVGGTMLAALLSGFREHPQGRWDQSTLQTLIKLQRAALSYRRARLDRCTDINAACADLLARLDSLLAPGSWQSSSTVHTSAVDELGNACAITASAGYGSGEMPPGTGLWLNNCLGELELNQLGYAAAPPGRRLPSNMTPGAARRGDEVLAFGSPGADRITTALQQFLVHFMVRGLGLQEAVDAPRLHVELADSGDRLAAEPGLDLPELDLPVTRYPGPNMYFGGVGAALYSGNGAFSVAADPRRAGGTSVAGR
jgi:gamma-glutamyltranspeptidase / glutathione hydrolase